LSLKLAYTALSPYCRKVRMAMEYKGPDFEIVAGDHVTEVPAFNPRAEVPVLIDDDTVVCNSPDILAYLDRRFPDRPLYPSDARAYARVREWERFADTQLDPIMTVIGNWKFANLPPMPAGLQEAARHDVAADFALYPQVVSGAVLGLPMSAQRHAKTRAWLRRMRDRPEGQSDLAAARDWWANRDKQTVDTERINWGTFRLEWLLASGGVEFFADQVRQGKVLWSVGPNSHARHNPHAPEWLK
jgi:glutathione S-transferase